MDIKKFFSIENLAGYGSFSKVFRAKTKKEYNKLPENTDVAIKVLIYMSPQELKNIQREISVLQSISSLGHCQNNIVCYFYNYVTLCLWQCFRLRAILCRNSAYNLRRNEFCKLLLFR